MSFVRTLQPGQRCEIHVLNVDTGEDRVIHSDCEVLFEAPNWTESGHLIVNGGGKLWSLPASGGVPQIIPIDGIPDVNNDHVLAPATSQFSFPRMTIGRSTTHRFLAAVPPE